MGLDPVLVMPKSCCPLGRLVCHSIVLLIFNFFFLFCHFIYGQFNIGCKNKIELFSFIGKKKSFLFLFLPEPGFRGAITPI